MRPLRIILISSVLIAMVGVGLAGYFMLFGPDHIEFGGKSLTELIQGGELLGVIATIAVLIVTVFMMLPVFRIVFPGEIKNGVTASATVLKVWDTGMSINDNPQVGLLLEVDSPEGRQLRIETKKIVSRLNAALVQPGVVAQIRYDPKNLKRVQVISIETTRPEGNSATARLEELERMRDKGLISHDEYEKKREEILKAL